MSRPPSAERMRALVLIVAALSASPALAQDGWESLQRETSRKSQPAPADPRPYLAPVEGRPSARAPQRNAPPPAETTSQPYATTPRDNRVDAAPLAPPPGYTSGAPDERARGVDRGELSPVIAADGSNLPHDLWQGLDAAALEKLIAPLEIPPRSPALHGLWRRLLSVETAPPSAAGDGRFEAIRLESLYRSGLLDELTKLLARPETSNTSPLLTALTARIEIGLGHKDKGCAAARALIAMKGEIPKAVRGDALTVSGYCAAAGGHAAGAGLSAELAREEGIEPTPALQMLDAIAIGGKPKVPDKKRIALLEYRLLDLGGIADRAALLERAEPALAAALALDPATEPRLRILAAEQAARLNALTPEKLAQIYLLNAPSGDPLDPAASRADPALRRASLFKAADTERTPLRKTRLARTFLDECRRAGLYLPALQMLAPSTEQIAPVQEVQWFAETAIEIALAGAGYERARQWAAFASPLDRPGGAGLMHWTALADIADANLRSAPRGASLKSVEDLALRGRFGADVLHRLATVLDALDYNVPIPLWEAASRTQQPSGGHLPDTGVLTELQDAAKRKEFGRTVLLALRALGANGAEGAHMIALGDSIRALKRAGLEADARRLGFEALFASWPRSQTN